MNNKKMNVNDRRDFMKLMGTAGFGVAYPAHVSLPSESLSENRCNVPIAQDYVEVWQNQDTETYVEGCGMVRTADSLVAIVPTVVRSEVLKRVGRRGTIPSVIHVLGSTDRGHTWQEYSELPYYSGVPWVHRGVLYLFVMKEGTLYRNDDLLILNSTDGGKTWSDPKTLFTGHYWNCHTGMVVRDNRLYWAVCDLPKQSKFGPPQRRPRVLVGNLLEDPMDPNAWRLSDPVNFPEVPQSLMNTKFRARSYSLEPNVIEVKGKIRVVSSTKPASQSTTSLACIYDVEDSDDNLQVKFSQYHPRPGGQLKFFIIWDQVSGMFWSTANLVVDGQNNFDWWSTDGPLRKGGNDRRFLMLFYGLDGLNWFQAGCIAQAKKTSQSFMYATPVIDGDDLAVISRSSIKGPNQHDADYATFHRVKNFRELAGLTLFPEQGQKE